MSRGCCTARRPAWSMTRWWLPPDFRSPLASRWCITRPGSTSESDRLIDLRRWSRGHCRGNCVARVVELGLLFADHRVREELATMTVFVVVRAALSLGIA